MTYEGNPNIRQLEALHRAVIEDFERMLRSKNPRDVDRFLQSYERMASHTHTMMASKGPRSNPREDPTS